MGRCKRDGKNSPIKKIIIKYRILREMKKMNTHLQTPTTQR
jgi:hypothetical protein